ncbi:MAG: ABC transporter ATP-binding protein [Candidatus Eremiobacteraeota bacterium]|nr:ABC transporter ATP-binding protein [Candidatus Eremiobacteraeota bacterium]
MNDVKPVVVLSGINKSFPEFSSLSSWIKGLGKPQPRRAVLNNIDLNVRRGDVFAFLGSNGAGKTTLLKMIATLLLPDGGAIEVAGVDALRDPMEVKRRIGLCTSEERSFYWRLTARANLEFFGTLSGVPRRVLAKRIEDVAATVDMTSALDWRMSWFSTGMRQRLAVARAMLADPEVLIFDEPTRAVDPVHAEEIRRLLRDRLAGELGKTVILSTNILEEAWAICDDVAILANGSIVAHGSPDSLGDRFTQRRRYAIVLDRMEPKFIERLRGLTGVNSLEVTSVDPEAHLTLDLEHHDRNLTGVFAALGSNGVAVRAFRQLDEEPFEVFRSATRTEGAEAARG